MQLRAAAFQWEQMAHQTLRLVARRWAEAQLPVCEGRYDFGIVLSTTFRNDA